jgi:hypothetical protein
MTQPGQVLLQLKERAKVRPDFSCSCAVSCTFVNVDGFTSSNQNSAMNRSHWLEGFGKVYVELSVHTGQQPAQAGVVSTHL